MSYYPLWLCNVQHFCSDANKNGKIWKLHVPFNSPFWHKKTSYHSHHFLNCIPRPMPSPFVHKIYNKTFNSGRRIKISFIFTLRYKQQLLLNVHIEECLSTHFVIYFFIQLRILMRICFNQKLRMCAYKRKKGKYLRN